VVGRTISHYKILEKLGEGGMGVVYKAEDTQLRRIVALKFLSSETVGNEDVKARLIREAQASASLDHPNICAVHGIHEEQGQTFIAMAFIDGPALADKIKERPLPLGEALGFAIQIAEGLQEAHEKGIVHRDVKPHNVMLTAKGQIKIMDFGLASLAGRSKLTKSGTTLGTPAYMAPEQLEGRDVDRRADIWALGCVLYEMLAQRTPFDAEYEQAIAYGILNEAPEPVSAQRADVQPEVDRIIAKALAKGREQRYQHADDLLVDLRALAEELKSDRSPGLSGPKKLAEQLESGSSRVLAGTAAATQGDALSRRDAMLAASQQDSAPGRKLRAFQAAFGVTAALAVGLLAVAVTHFREAPPERPVRRFTVIPEDIPRLAHGWTAISPDGKHIVYISGGDERAVWVRDIDGLVPRRLPQTEGAARPFWSPDSEFVGFGAGGELKKISVQGRTPTTLCPLPANNFAGGAWSPDGERVVFGSGGPTSLFEVSARGGQAERLFDHAPMEMGPYVGSPHFLPVEAGVDALVFDVGDSANRKLAVRNLETGEWDALGAGIYPIYSPSGHILYQTDSYETGLWALPFSIETLKPTGEAFPIDENSRFPSVAKDGTLVSVERRGDGLKQLVWRNRAGEKLGEIGQPQESLAHPALSPDGRYVAVRSNEGGNADIWVHSVERPIKRRLTLDSALDSRPQWSPSGREIAFQSGRGGINVIFRRASDGTGEAELLVGTEVIKRPWGWSRDGNYFVYTSLEQGNSDLWYLKRKGDGAGFESVPFLVTPFSEIAPNLSPDGRFLAYCSDVSGEDQVYV